MNNNSRIKNSIVNSIYASGSQIITLALTFLVRTVFIRKLSVEYLGVNGLFSNIITMLSLADLGIGISIPYTLYKPLAHNNKEKIKALMSLYSKIYNIIGLTVLIIGIGITPFLNYLVKEMPNIPNIQLIYILFVVNSALSYFFVYKKLLLDSDQKGYISTKIIMKVTILKSILEIMVLYFTQNYILYLIIPIISTILQNIVISIKCNKMYPYIREKTTQKVEKSDIVELKNNTIALIFYRLGSVVLNGTDNIVISKYIGIAMVGIYSNYLMIVNAITKIVSQIFDAITASIGNMVVTTDNNKSEDILYKLQFLNFWLYTFFSVCVTVLINAFIKIWAGEEYVLSSIVAFIIGLNLYVYGMQGVVSSYRNAYGLFVQGKYRPIIMSIANIILSIVLVQFLGIFGVILSNVICRLFIMGIYDPIVVFKHGIKKSPKNYYINYLKYLVIYVILSILGLMVISKINILNYLTWGIVAIIVSILTNVILIILFYKNENFKFYKQKLVEIVKYRIKKRGK